MKNNFIKVVAFTLAETLVVMGIIGVVAALTIPNLNQSTGDREKVAKLKKVYANLEDAYGRATAVYGPVETWFVNDGNDKEACATRFADRITEFMKVSKKNSYDSFALADGTHLSFYLIPEPQHADTCNHYENAGYFGSIFVDIDGLNKGKNKDGHDRFEFEITDQGILPSNTEYYEDDIRSDGVDGYYTTAWVIQNGNMDYLKCADELSWSGQTTCK